MSDLITSQLYLRFYFPPFPNSGSMSVQVPNVYVQGFLKKANEYHNK